MLKADDVKCLDNQRKKLKKELYTKMYETFSKKIKLAASLHQTSTVVPVPGFMFGYPAYDQRKATLYLQRQLELNGFVTSLVTDSDIYVSWATAKGTAPPVVPEPVEDFPTLVNLRKLADKYKRAS